jgi:hypothetical protein
VCAEATAWVSLSDSKDISGCTVPRRSGCTLAIAGTSCSSSRSRSGSAPSSDADADAKPPSADAGCPGHRQHNVIIAEHKTAGTDAPHPE